MNFKENKPIYLQSQTVSKMRYQQGRSPLKRLYPFRAKIIEVNAITAMASLPL